MNRCFQDDLGSRWRQIEKFACELHAEIWERRYELWGGSPPDDEVRLLEPGVAFGLLGYEAQSSECLGQFLFEGHLTEVAGLIDSREKVVHISRRFPSAFQLFTAAHELGHAKLHPEIATLHRDRSLSGSEQHRDWREREADWFATCFLMPARLVRDRFHQAFGTDNFKLTNDTAFALSATSVEKVLRVVRRLRDLSYKLAETNLYGGKQLVPMNLMFGVSKTAMAIRLEQLGLVAPIDCGWRAPEYLLKELRQK